MKGLNLNNKGNILLYLTYFVTSFCIVLLSVAIVGTVNIQKDKNFGESNPAIPSKLFDANGRIITQFISDENRELLSLKEMPDNLIKTLLIREDTDFYSHRGFSLIGMLRAAFNIVLGRYFSGGSTLTQQLAKLLYTNQAKRSVLRKLNEIWWAIQLEKKLSKYEILERYLNKVYFGNGNYGVVAAASFFFNKSVRDINTAEAVLMLIQLPNAKLYSPFYNPEFSKKIQRAVLNQVVANGIISPETAEREFSEYWENYDWTRMADTSAVSYKEDNAPYFSEYIRQRVVRHLPAGANVYKDGYSIFTTLDLDAQKCADRVTRDMIFKARKMYNSTKLSETIIINSEIVPVLDTISDLFGIASTRVNGKQYRKLRTKKFYEDNIDLIASFAAVLGADLVDKATKEYTMRNRVNPNSVVQPEGAFIAIDTTTGAIKAMVGGSGYNKGSEFNRATQAKIQPGSAFKSLYFSAAIDLKKITPATMFSDSPVAFFNETGDVYAPENYGGKWRGSVLTRKVLALSLNIPSLRILDTLGFEDAINYSAKLLGIKDQTEINKTFPKVYPLALGVISTSPIQMTRAFAILGNNGREVEPYGIKHIEDRNGKIVANVESDILTKIKNKGANAQIVSPQAAYIMTDMMKSTIQYGTLANQRYTNLKDFSSDIAGKSGTTQNWADGWAIGYSPYITAALWVGFDKKGYSLGTAGTGTGLAGPSWGKFMSEYHKNLPKKVFIRPAGIINVAVQAETGLLPEGVPNEKIINEIFIEGTQPFKKSKYYENQSDFLNKMEFNVYGIDNIDNNDDINIETHEFEYINYDFDKINETENKNQSNLNKDNNNLEGIHDNEINSQETQDTMKNDSADLDELEEKHDSNFKENDIKRDDSIPFEDVSKDVNGENIQLD
ncbi:penicillin-binding protein 1A [Borrelia sp. P9F1]|uniref:penicillin-binding protein 1A n=1 Tax=Borrelia sp. P9F1 TaxID=3058374 RepID=UPI002649524E|nr:PBP1A family penicillin-binding protein [Borrelia sp. P9F1]WKC58267.1 PBP1A family penicillin-binding protein [Borrelia sp. P9F1]